MKFKVYIFKKQQLIWAAVILAAIIVLVLVLTNLKTKKTFNTIGPEKTLNNVDVDNDGRDDTIIVDASEDTGELSVSIITKDGSAYSLEADHTVKTLGYNSSWWPMNIVVDDINKDGTSEIVLQSGDKNGPILHIFKYNSGKMERLASGRYSVFGTLEPPSEKSSIIVLGMKQKDSINFSYFQTKSGRLIPYTAPTPLALGKDTLSSLISYIEKEEIEASSINAESKYVSKISKGEYLDCSFVDARYTKYNVPSECTYLLRTSTMDGENKIAELYRVKIILTKYDDKTPEYRITSISKL